MFPLILVVVAVGIWAWTRKHPSDTDVAAVQAWVNKCRPGLGVYVARGNGQPGTDIVDWKKLQSFGAERVLVLNPGRWMLAAPGGSAGANVTWIEWATAREMYLAGKCA